MLSIYRHVLIRDKVVGGSCRLVEACVDLIAGVGAEPPADRKQTKPPGKKKDPEDASGTASATIPTRTNQSFTVALFFVTKIT